MNRKKKLLSVLLCFALLLPAFPTLADGGANGPFVYLEYGRVRVDYYVTGAKDQVNYYLYDANNKLIDFIQNGGGVWYPNVSVSGSYLARVIVTDSRNKISTADSGYVYLDVSGQGGNQPPLTNDIYQIKTTLPVHQYGAFTKNYAVYQGPGTDYYRSANGKALLGRGGGCRVYGTDGEWLLVGYETSKGDYRIGYIKDYTLPKEVNASLLSSLQYAYTPVYLMANIAVTDDPVKRFTAIDSLMFNNAVSFLAWVDDTQNYAMIEYWSSQYNQAVRAFVPGAYLSTMPGTSPVSTPRPTVRPTLRPTAKPTARPTAKPTARPTVKPTPLPTGTNVVLPSYQKGRFDQSYAVYQGPDTSYYRANGGKAAVGGGGVCRVYGTDGNWLLIGYELSDGSYRLGYIQDYVLPDSVDASKLRSLSYAWIPTYVTEDTRVTDDPVIKMKSINTIPEGTNVTFLAWVSSKHNYAMIEYYSEKFGENVRAFVKGSHLALFQ